jgi:hypothetical protein
MKARLIVLSALALSSLNAFAGKDIPVNFIILQESNGQGNEIWVRDNAHIQAVLNKINADYYNKDVATLKLGIKKIKKDSKLYNSNMSNGGSSSLIEIFQNEKNNFGLEENGAILVVIAREEKVDVNGRAERQDTDYSPTFIMRSVRNNLDPKAKDYIGGAAAIRTDAGLFVHEMGHLMDLRHKDNSKYSYHTDNYTVDDKGIEVYKKYFKQMSEYKPKSGKSFLNPPSGNGGGNSGGSGSGSGGRGSRSDNPRADLN